MDGSGEGHEHNPIQVSDNNDHVVEKDGDGMPMTDSPVEMTATDAVQEAMAKLESHNGHAAEQADEDGSEDDSDESEAGDDVEAAEVEDEAEEGDEEEDDDEDEDEDEDDEEGDEDDDDEPALKYERLGGDFPKLFEKDSASTLTISNKTLASHSHVCLVHSAEYNCRL